MTEKMGNKQKNKEIVREVAESFFAHLKAKGLHPTPEQVREIAEKFTETINYHPKVGIFGKTGVGKSTLCNAIFGKDVAPVSDIGACTREPQKIVVGLTEDGNGITLLDVPGVGENKIRDEEYEKLYKNLLPELDIVLWVLKGDDRAFSVDEHFYNNIVLPSVKESKVPVIFVINQVDLIKPSREWNLDLKLPSENQKVNIEEKVRLVHESFGIPLSKICAVSAEEHYGLIDLVEKIVRYLPEAKKYSITREAQEETVSEKANKEAQKGVLDTIMAFVSKVFKEALPYLIEGLFRIIFKKWF